ncbi:MAG: flagellar biosynthesis protein FlgD [Bdellovibrionaceae bacterium]|nr:flagellar biosynthesis protein FlgD [Pseudobdellovibrionaceae bacterium]
MTVMGSKLGTKAFGQTQAAPTSQNSMANNMSATDMKKLSGDDVGDVLNKVADPNWVDPSKKMRAVGNDKMDKDAFFKLMLTQMKNQDPMNPMQSHEMAAQLASFTSLEQMQNMNKTLTEISNAQKPSEQFQVLQFLGKSVAGDSSKIFRAKGDKDHDLLFDLPNNAKEVEIKLKNADGDIVKTYKLNNLKMGSNRIMWNGTDEKGTVVPEGEYQFSVEAKNEQDKKIAIKTDFEGQITGVNYTKEGPILMVGNQAVRLRDVKKIVDTQLAAKAKSEPMSVDPKLMSQESKAADVVNPQAPKDTKGGAPEAPAKSKILDQVGLSSEMMAKIAKETQ